MGIELNPVVVNDTVVELYGKQLVKGIPLTSPERKSTIREAKTLLDVWECVLWDSLSIAEVLEETFQRKLPKVCGPEDLPEVDEELSTMAEPPSRKNPRDYKLDTGKLDYTLLMHDMAPAVRQVVNCLHWGHYTKGYPRNGYKTLPGGTDRLVAACYRHMAAMAEDFNALDEESGLPHAVHAITNLLMAMSQEVDK